MDDYDCDRCGTCCKAEIGISIEWADIVRANRNGQNLFGKAVKARTDITNSDGGLVVKKGGYLLPFRDGVCQYLETLGDGLTSCKINEFKPNKCKNYPEGRPCYRKIKTAV